MHPRFSWTHVLFSLATLLLAVPLHAQPATDLSLDAVSERIDAVLQRDAYVGASWGIAVTDVNTGEVLYTHNAEKNFVPASNAKLLTSAAALEHLGPDYRYRTRVYVDGPVRDGTLEGNLIVRGSGDPTLGSSEGDAPPTAVFRAWADSLRARGIRHIAGDVVGDDDFIDDTPLGYGWSWDDAPYGYAAEIGGLVFHDNTVELRIEGRQPGMPGRLEWMPGNTEYVSVQNRTRTVRGLRRVDESYQRQRGTNEILAATQLPPGATEREAITVTNPTLFFTHVLRDVLLDKGISVQGRPVDVDAIPIKPSYTAEAMQRVATHVSPPLRRIAAQLNAESLNLYAEQVLRTLGTAPLPNAPPDLASGTSARGAFAVRSTLARAGVDTSHVTIADGSGLSRYNLVSADALVRLLQYMWAHPDTTMRDAFYESLPVGGKNGTLSYRFRGRDAANGNVRAKTGTLTGISALSGFVTSARGTPLAFAIVCNHHTTSGRTARTGQDVIVNALARLAQ